MKRCNLFAGVLCLLAAAPAGLWAQYSPAGGFAPAYPSAAAQRDRRARREVAVAKVGPAGRDFVEAHGEEAVAAVSRCSKDVAVKLAEFHACGGLDKLPRPDDLLRAIARPGYGDDVCLWAIKHHEELEDADGFEAYVEDPLEYALGLKKLAAGAAEARARRQAALAAPPAAASPVPPLPQVTEQEAVLVGAGVLIVFALLIWRRRQRQQGL